MKKGTYLFFISFLAGVLAANFLGIALGRDTGAMGEYYMNRYLYTDISGRELFVYLFYERVPRAFLLFLLSAGVGIWMIYGYVLYLGLTIGILSVISIISYGVKAFCLCLLFFFPNGFFIYRYSLCGMVFWGKSAGYGGNWPGIERWEKRQNGWCLRQGEWFF